jgi:glycerol-3-phosphate acyltransferase PlsX
MRPRIAIDAMGGDHGVPVMVAGAALARQRHSDFRFLLVGDQKQIESALNDHPNLRAASDILHTDQTVSGDEKIAQALRKSKTSSMGLAIQAMKSGEVSASVSGGNTAAMMAIAKMALRTMPGIDRPALAAFLPTATGKDVVMLDVGANTIIESKNLVEFAVMGAAYVRITLGVDRPRTWLLNIGSEDQKGKEEIREAADILRGLPADHLDFCGFIEGDKINSGIADVIVSEGFAGNIALKTVEGTARFVTDLLKQAFTSSIRSKFGFLVSRPATELLRHHLDPNNHNGAVFLGLNGVVVKSHGSASVAGVAKAVEVAARLVEENITARIAQDIERINRRSEAEI